MIDIDFNDIIMIDMNLIIIINVIIFLNNSFLELFFSGTKDITVMVIL